MIKIAPRQYNVNVNETILVSVQATGTVHAVVSDLDGEGAVPLAAGQTLTFRVAPPKTHRTLTLLFTFSGNSGGKYVVGINGGDGGSDTDTVNQGSFGIPTTTTRYRFQL